MNFLIDVNKIPRPERSGVVSMLVLYLLLTTVSDIQMASYPDSKTGELHGWKAVACWLVPCAMLPGFYQQQENRTVPKLRWRLITMLPGSKVSKKICTCHVDIGTSAGIEHLHLKEEFTCDSTPDGINAMDYNTNWSFQRGNFAFVGMDGYIPMFADMHRDVGPVAWRYHCE